MKIVFCDLNTHEVDACKNENIENLRELERTRGHYAHLVRSACTVMIRYMIFIQGVKTVCAIKRESNSTLLVMSPPLISLSMFDVSETILGKQCY